MTTGLVLEGGGKRGIYTAGVLDVFGENGVGFDGVIGVSAGAIHGCSYVAGQVGRSIRYNLKYGHDYRFMSFRSLILSGNMVDAKFCYEDLPERLDPFDHEAFESSGCKFYVTCSNLESGQAEYVYCPDLRKRHIDYLRASASLPLVSKIVEIDGKKYLDGGICDSIPLQAFMDLGYERNVVVLTRPQGYRKPANRWIWPARLKYRKYPAFVKALANRHLMYNSELDLVSDMESQGKALIIRPSRKINISKMERNLDKVKEMYELGRADAQRVLPQVREFLRKGC